MTEKPTRGESPEERGALEKPGSQDVKQLQELYDLMLVEGLDSIELKDAESGIRLTRHRDLSGQGLIAPHAPDQRQNRAAASPSSESEPTPDLTDVVAAPLAGVFYRASSPTSAPFVKEGDTVDPGQTLCIVEAMKVMNEIKAEKRCRIVRIAAENSRPVTAGQTLFRVEPA